MNQIKGLWFDGQRSGSEEATLSYDDSGYVKISTPSTSKQYSLNSIEVSSRLGNTPRRLRFDDDCMFETNDNDEVDSLFKQHSSKFTLHTIESNLLIGLSAVVLLGIFSWWFLTDGLPKTSKYIAYQLPESMTESLGKQILSFIDYTSFEETTLSQEKQKQVSKLFETIVINSEMQTSNCELKFYSAVDSFGPNAFALPPCLIIATDEFIQLADNDDQISAVLAHEIGHIHYRHTLRRIVQSSFVSFAILMISGDATQIPADILGFPALFMELGYSRDFEREADSFAHAYMKKYDIPLNSFPDILRKLEQWTPPEEECEEDCDELEIEDITTIEVKEDIAINDEKEPEEKSFSNWSTYFSTHPHTEERALLFKE